MVYSLLYKFVDIYGNSITVESMYLHVDLAGCMKDIDLFSTGVVHNFSSRHEKTGKLAQQIKLSWSISLYVCVRAF